MQRRCCGALIPAPVFARKDRASVMVGVWNTENVLLDEIENVFDRSIVSNLRGWVKLSQKAKRPVTVTGLKSKQHLSHLSA